MYYIDIIMARPRKTAGDSKVAVGYLRVSTEDQNLGPEAQRAAIERWATAHGVDVVAWCEDLGISGGASADKRPGLMGALAALKEHHAGWLVAAKRDRIARDTVVAAMVEQAAARVGATVATADGASDGAGPEGQLFRQMLDTFAQYERGVIRARTRAALAVKKSRGERTGMIPFGFQLSADGVHLEPNPGEQTIVEKVRALRAGGMTLQSIADALDEAGLVSRAGRPLSVVQVHRIAVAA